MVATVILGMLCVHLLCFSTMFLLISKRLEGNRMGMEVFALGNLLLGMAYALQLLSGVTSNSAIDFINHTMTLCAPVAYALGAARFFNLSVPVWQPLLAVAGLYTTAQVLVEFTLGTQARHAMLAGACAMLFLAMVVTLLRGMRTFAKDMRAEMALFAVLIAGICGLNAATAWPTPGASSSICMQRTRARSLSSPWRSSPGSMTSSAKSKSWAPSNGKPFGSSRPGRSWTPCMTG